MPTQIGFILTLDFSEDEKKLIRAASKLPETVSEIKSLLYDAYKITDVELSNFNLSLSLNSTKKMTIKAYVYDSTINADKLKLNIQNAIIACAKDSDANKPCPKCKGKKCPECKNTGILHDFNVRQEEKKKEEEKKKRELKEESDRLKYEAKYPHICPRCNGDGKVVDGKNEVSCSSCPFARPGICNPDRCDGTMTFDTYGTCPICHGRKRFTDKQFREYQKYGNIRFH